MCICLLLARRKTALVKEKVDLLAGRVLTQTHKGHLYRNGHGIQQIQIFRSKQHKLAATVVTGAIAPRLQLESLLGSGRETQLAIQTMPY
mmetsp:Transcript_25880/g.55064  ORF Transcript_25880/g.55064 Transcript_25880/m.55064 type:complete len:90 (-) Transcript_25880:224-493(-)